MLLYYFDVLLLIIDAIYNPPIAEAKQRLKAFPQVLDKKKDMVKEG